MKAILTVAVLAVLFIVTPRPCFALWATMSVDQEGAKNLGIEIRQIEGWGPNEVRIELEFKSDGELKNFDSVVLSFGDENEPRLTATLKEDRSKEGRVIVSFSAGNAQLDTIHLLIVLPVAAGRQIYDIRIKDFVGKKNK
jgi:hypothetical protein